MYQYQRPKVKRRPRFFLIIMLCLILAVAASIFALWIRGFKFSDLIKTNNAQFSTPDATVWLVKTNGYTSKMDAYKVGIANADYGFATHVQANGEQWQLIEGVFLTQVEANTMLQDTNLPATTVSSQFTVTSKTYTVDANVATDCQQVMTTLEQAFNKLLAMRELATNGNSTKNATLEITNYYNTLKQTVTTLNKVNVELKDATVSQVIYVANQNILGLYDVIFTNATEKAYLSVINTALAKYIFSLDNFQ